MIAYTKPSPLPTSFQRTVEPSFELITVADARQHLRLPDFPGEATDSSEDAYLTALIAAAGEAIETDIARPVRAQTRVITVDRNRIEQGRSGGVYGAYRGWAYNEPIVLNNTPIRAISTIKWRDENDVEQTVPASDYRVDGAGEGIQRTVDIYPVEGRYWPWHVYSDNDSPDISIEVECGWTEGNVPAPLIHACRILVSTFYNFRDAATMVSTSTAPRSVQYLLAQYERVVFV